METELLTLLGYGRIYQTQANQSQYPESPTTFPHLTASTKLYQIRSTQLSTSLLSWLLLPCSPQFGYKSQEILRPVLPNSSEIIR